jgi:Tfp pilus assembly pilus retraction ATPase PilT
MSLMPSLCAALQRAGGQRLVMRAGDRPHVLAGDRRHDVATAVLSVNAVEALVDQILSTDSRRALGERGSVEEVLNTPAFPHPLTARAERVGDDFCVELILSVDAPEAPPEPVPAHPTASAAAEVIQETAAVEVPVPDAMDEPTPEPIVTHAIEPVQAVEETPVVALPAASHVIAEPPAPEPMVPLTVEPVAPPVVQHAASGLEQHPPSPASAVARFAPPVTEAGPVRVVTRIEQAQPAVGQTTPARMDLHGWIAYAFERGATTLFLRAGAPAAARINDRIVPFADGLVSASVFEEVADFTGRSGDGLWRSVAESEWACDHEHFGHVTCRLFSDDQGTGLVVQLRPRTSPKLLHKYIPRQVRHACEGDGLILVAAPSEVDVESLAAAIADWSGRTRGGYVISLHKRHGRADLTGAFVSHRTIAGSDSDFATAVRRASHEGPDILLIIGPQTEMALHEAVFAAAAGRLVIVAVVAPTALIAMRTMLGQGGLDRDAHVRRAFAASFRAAISYRSVRRLGGGRMLVQDLVTASKDVRSLIELGDFDGLGRLQRQGAPGVRSVDDALARAAGRGQISLREAVAGADDRRRLVALVRSRAHGRSRDGIAERRSADHAVHVPMALSR